MEIKCTELGGELDIQSIEEGEVKKDSLASALLESQVQWRGRRS